MVLQNCILSSDGHKKMYGNKEEMKERMKTSLHLKKYTADVEVEVE